MDAAVANSRFRIREERANSITHAIGAGLSVAALAVLVTLAARLGDAWRVVSFSVYGSTLTLLYVASTLYHSVRSPTLKRAFRVLDHAAIFLLIAGTYTPFTLVTLRGGWGWSLFGLVWALALGGVLLKVFFVGRFRAFSVALYIGMGWLVVFAVKPLVTALPAGGVTWLAAGGLAYTLGVAFYLWERFPFHHAVWHLFVLAGSVCQFLSVLLYVLPMRGGAS